MIFANMDQIIPIGNGTVLSNVSNWIANAPSAIAQAPGALAQAPSAVANALGWAVLQSLWQGLALAIILWCVRTSFLTIGGEQTARSRYLAGMITLFAFISAFIASFLYALFVKFPVATQSAVTAPSTITAAAPEAVPALASSSFLSTLLLPLLELADHTNLIGMIWAFCVGVLALRYCMAYRLTHKLRTEGLSPLPSNWLSIFETLTRDAGVNSSVRCYISSHVASPITFGFLKPIVLVPTWFFTGLSPQQCEAIILHELAHIARYDYLVNIGQIIIKTILFYHPCTHYICKAIGEDREHACDDFAVRLSKNPESLATALGTIRIRAAKSSGVFVLAADHGNSPIYRRLQRLVGTSEKPILITSSSRSYATSAALATVIFASLGFSAVQSQAHPTFGANLNNTELAGADSAHTGELSKSARRWFFNTVKNGVTTLDGDHVLSDYYYDTMKLSGTRYLTKVGPTPSGKNETYIKIDGTWYDIDQTDLDALLDRTPKAQARISSHTMTPSGITVTRPNAGNIRVRNHINTAVSPLTPHHPITPTPLVEFIEMPPVSKLVSLEKFVDLSIKAIDLKRQTNGNNQPLSEQQEFGKEVLQFAKTLLQQAQQKNGDLSVNIAREFEPITEFIDQTVQHEIDKALAAEAKKLGLDSTTKFTWDGTFKTSELLLHTLQETLSNADGLSKKQKREIQKQLREAEKQLKNGYHEHKKGLERARKHAELAHEKTMERANEQRDEALEHAHEQREEALEHARNHREDNLSKVERRAHNQRMSQDIVRTAQHKELKAAVMAKLLACGLIKNTKNKIKIKIKPTKAYLNGTRLSQEDFLDLSKIINLYIPDRQQFKVLVFKPDALMIQHGNMDGSNIITYNYHSSEQ